MDCRVNDVLPASKSRGTRFGLRSLLLVVTIAAVTLGLFFAKERRQQESDERRQSVSDQLETIVRGDLTKLGRADDGSSSKTGGGNALGPRGRYEWQSKFILPPSLSATGGGKILESVQATFESSLPSQGFLAYVGTSDPGGRPFGKTFRDPGALSFSQTFHDSNGEMFVVVDAWLNDDSPSQQRPIIVVMFVSGLVLAGKYGPAT
jgi:hypothetical protein